jgi:hypothetical protein
MNKDFKELSEAEQWHLISQIEAGHRGYDILHS